MMIEDMLTALAKKAYELYKQDWCKSRGYSFDEVNEETGIGGECYVCFDEFCTNSFVDEQYIKSLLSKRDYKLWSMLKAKCSM